MRPRVLLIADNLCLRQQLLLAEPKARGLIASTCRNIHGFVADDKPAAATPLRFCLHHVQ
jgi:hypothetical protein